MVRYFEDSTRVTEGGSVAGASTRDDGITPATAAAMARCGVDLLGLDQLTVGDPRLDALVWSWAPGEPGSGECAVQRADARWEARTCDGRHHAACRAADGSWRVTARAEPRPNAERACASQSAVLAAPRTGYEGQLLRVAMEAAGASEAWLGLTRAGDAWARTRHTPDGATARSACVGGDEVTADPERVASKMMLPDTAHTSRPWRIHEIAPDFRLEDVWALPTPGGPDDFPRLVEQFASTDPSHSLPAPARMLGTAVEARGAVRLGRRGRRARLKGGDSARPPSCGSARRPDRTRLRLPPLQLALPAR